MFVLCFPRSIHDSIGELNERQLKRNALVLCHLPFASITRQMHPNHEPIVKSRTMADWSIYNLRHWRDLNQWDTILFHSIKSRYFLWYVDFTTPRRLGRLDAKARELVVHLRFPHWVICWCSSFFFLLFCFHLFCYLPYQYSTYAVINEIAIRGRSWKFTIKESTDLRLIHRHWHEIHHDSSNTRA